MSRNLVAFAAGGLFALGLVISGMTQPAKVIAFLDFAGDWDPSLAFVMVGAIGVCLPAFRVLLRRPAPLLAPRFVLPAERAITRRLVAGAAIFGVGWGITGFCPGPGIVGIGAGALPAVVFVLAMLVGIRAQWFFRPRA